MKSLKKIFLAFVLCLTAVLPFKAMAATSYEKMNLDEALTQEKIEHDFKNYKETDDQITIYLFRGYGCGYCRNFLTFLNSIVGEYGKYFKVVSYETWYNQDNYNLMVEVSSFLGQPAQGVPYVIIGNQIFPGYASSYDDKIKEAIKNLYDTKKEDRYDVMKEYEKSKKDSKKDDSTSDGSSLDINPWIVIGINCAIVLAATISIIYVVNGQNKTLYKKLDNVQKELDELKSMQEKPKTEKTIKEEKTSTEKAVKKETKPKAKKTTKK